MELLVLVGVVIVLAGRFADRRRSGVSWLTMALILRIRFNYREVV